MCPVIFLKKFEKTFKNLLTIHALRGIIYTEIKERRKAMSKKKKSGNQDQTLKIIILITAIFNLIKSIFDLIHELLE